MKRFSIKLIVAMAVAGLVAMVGIWQVYSSYQALHADVATKQQVNV